MPDTMLLNGKNSSIYVTLSGTSQAISGVKAGVRYYVSTDTNCWFMFGAAAVAGQGVMAPTNQPQIFMFAKIGDADPDLRVIAGGAGKLTMTPVTIME